MEEMTRRELAFSYIYSQEIQKSNENDEQIETFLDCLEVNKNRDKEYVKQAVEIINKNEEEINKLIEENLKKGWELNRISLVDLALLKLAIYEINYLKTPYKIIINEVVNMAKKYGEENSKSFVNGVLASIVAKNNQESEQ